MDSNRTLPTQLREFAKFFVRSAALAACLAIPSVALLRVNAPRNDFFEAITDKLRRLQTLGSPKIVLVGGSAAALGTDSPLIEQELGLPVVNMGLHAGLGLRAMLQMVAPHVGARDIVVVSPEYELLYRSFRPTSALYELLNYVPGPDAYLNSLVESARFRLYIASERIQHNFNYVVKKPLGAFRMPDPVYGRGGFNVEGDVLSHLGRPSEISQADLTPARSPRQEIDLSRVEALRAFAIDMNRRGAHVVVAYPPQMSVAHAADLVNIAAVDSILRSRLKRVVQFASTPEEFVYDPSLFFDTTYHLTRAGREIRTQTLIRFLRTVVEE